VSAVGRLPRISGCAQRTVGAPGHQPLARGEDVYHKWGRAAVFMTPSIVSGVLAMKSASSRCVTFWTARCSGRHAAGSGSASPDTNLLRHRGNWPGTVTANLADWLLTDLKSDKDLRSIPVGVTDHLAG
jgi:hypothetical protein